jgi:putative colanic acid biosynthesis UDP-glucose lipid carrier transferase
MSNAKQLHRAAMSSLQQADEAVIQRDISLYKQKLSQALALETDAAMLLKDKITSEPTRSILFRSAASIAISCGEYKQAEKLVVEALRGEPPREIKYELLELFNDALVEPVVISAQKIFFKRAFDIIFSTLVLATLWPIFVLISILIKMDSKGPVLYKQIRIGQNNRAFYCLKFRTMKDPDESIDNQNETKDERVTRMGKWLRQTDLDELPQFFNVLKGDMAVVGPRPLPTPVEHSNSYASDSYKVRHSATPGITGLALALNLEGEPNSYMQYTQHWSILLDLKIIFLAIIKR